MRFVLQQLGDPKIEQLDLTIATHRHVGGLKVPVHNQLCVGIFHGLQNIAVGRQLNTRPGSVRKGGSPTASLCFVSRWAW